MLSHHEDHMILA